VPVDPLLEKVCLSVRTFDQKIAAFRAHAFILSLLLSQFLPLSCDAAFSNFSNYDFTLRSLVSSTRLINRVFH
ncbi:MAG: hypothetical protein ACK56I_21280, partial [bacterium]